MIISPFLFLSFLFLVEGGLGTTWLSHGDLVVVGSSRANSHFVYGIRLRTSNFFLDLQ